MVGNKTIISSVTTIRFLKQMETVSRTGSTAAPDDISTGILLSVASHQK